MDNKRRIVGRKAVMRVSPTDSPKTPVARGKLRPHLACLEEERRKQELEALNEFRAKYRAAREAWAAGNRRAVFPYGTYRLLSIGVRCAGPPAVS